MSRKDKKPKETIEFIENILLQNHIKYQITSELNNCNCFYSVRVEIDNGLKIGTNGKGMTYELALASGLAELMERLQSRNGMKFWYSTKNYPNKAFECEYQSNDLLEKIIQDDFERFVGSNLYQYRIDYVNEVTKKKVSVPNRLLNLLCGSNGLCAGNSKEEAIVQGVSEIFERYVHKCISKDHIKCPYIEKKEIEKYAVYQKMKCIEEHGFIWEVLDCTNGDKYPVVGLIVLERKMSRYAFVLGSDVDFEIALERCITEMLQGKTIDTLAQGMQKVAFEKVCSNTFDWNLEKPSDYYDFVDNYINNSVNSPIYLFYKDNRETVSVPKIFRKMDDNTEALQYVFEILRKNNLQMYTGDFSYLGFPTYRVYVPRLSQIFDIDEQSYKYIDSLQENMKKIMRIDSLTQYEKNELLQNFILLSTNYTYRRSPFSSVLFRFYGNKDFDFNFLYLDFVIALLLMSNHEYENALFYYSRFIKEHQIFKINSRNELLKVIYVYLNEMSQGYDIEDIYRKLDFLFNHHTNRYVYEFIKYEKCLNMVYWPKCPECSVCPYNKECLYSEWQRFDEMLRKKQKVYYSKERIEIGLWT